MLPQQNQFQFNNAIKQISKKSIENLEPFVEKYLSVHSYFKSRDIAIDYLNDKHQITLNNLDKDRKIILFLTRRFANLLKPYKLNGNISKYNAKTYRVIK